MTLDQLVKLQKEYKKLYDKHEGLIDINSNEVHTNYEFFKSNFKEYNRRFYGSYIKIFTEYDGVKVMALVSPETKRDAYMEEMMKIPKEGK